MLRLVMQRYGDELKMQMENDRLRRLQERENEKLKERQRVGEGGSLIGVGEREQEAAKNYKQVTCCNMELSRWEAILDILS